MNDITVYAVRVLFLLLMLLFFRWLVIKKRDEEAYSIFSVINQSSKKENDLIMFFDFLSLTESRKKDTKFLIGQFLKWKYLRR